MQDKAFITINFIDGQWLAVCAELGVSAASSSIHEVTKLLLLKIAAQITPPRISSIGTSSSYFYTYGSDSFK